MALEKFGGLAVAAPSTEGAFLFAAFLALPAIRRETIQRSFARQRKKDFQAVVHPS
jgi:hypothetical protein